MSSNSQPFVGLQKGEQYSEMDYMLSKALLSQLIIVYDGCFQVRSPIKTSRQQNNDHKNLQDNSDDDLPDLIPGDSGDTFVDFSWMKKRHVRSNL
ncbi:hypothetical protein C8R43DRAFT_1125051 [Mycena crocata]|nr:hypothetical protein C8R43DRAFT_1125051 [Mycena crocata]